MDNKVAPVPAHLRGAVSRITALCKIWRIYHLHKDATDLLLVIYPDGCPPENVRAIRRGPFPLSTCITVISGYDFERLRTTPCYTLLRSVVFTGTLIWHDRPA